MMTVHYNDMLSLYLAVIHAELIQPLDGLGVNESASFHHDGWKPVTDSTELSGLQLAPSTWAYLDSFRR